MVFPIFLSSQIFSFIIYFLLLCYFFLNFKQTFIPKIAYPLLIASPIGLINMNGSNYDIIKDLAYVLNPVIVLTLGFLISKKIKNINSIVKMIIFASLVISIYHTYNFIFVENLEQRNLAYIRTNLTRGYFLPVIGISILLFDKNKYIGNDKSFFLKYLLIFILLLSIFLSLSRTIIIFLVIMYFANNNFSMSNLFFRPKFYLLTFISVVLGLLFINFNNYEILNQFFNKFLNIFYETSFGNYSTRVEINEKWRGYESYRALLTFRNGNWFEYIFGQGFGTLIDLDYKIRLGENNFWEIPILHNGYLYLLVKTGFVGVFCYLFFLYKLFFVKNSFLVSNTSIIPIIRGGALILILSTYVNAGIYNKSAFIPLLLIIGSFYHFYNADLK